MTSTLKPTEKFNGQLDYKSNCLDGINYDLSFLNLFSICYEKIFPEEPESLFLHVMIKDSSNNTKYFYKIFNDNTVELNSSPVVLEPNSSSSTSYPKLISLNCIQQEDSLMIYKFFGLELEGKELESINYKVKIIAKSLNFGDVVFSQNLDVIHTSILGNEIHKFYKNDNVNTIYINKILNDMTSKLLNYGNMVGHVIKDTTSMSKIMYEKDEEFRKEVHEICNSITQQMDHKIDALQKFLTLTTNTQFQIISDSFIQEITNINTSSEKQTQQTIEKIEKTQEAVQELKKEIKNKDIDKETIMKNLQKLGKRLYIHYNGKNISSKKFYNYDNNTINFRKCVVLETKEFPEKHVFQILNLKNIRQPTEYSIDILGDLGTDYDISEKENIIEITKTFNPTKTKIFVNIYIKFL